jgi:hypothetical protein
MVIVFISINFKSRFHPREPSFCTPDPAGRETPLKKQSGLTPPFLHKSTTKTNTKE